MYHEGVPGHHLQIATAVYQRDSLNDFQRLIAGTSGHAEGWALYAERLMRELGYLDDDPLLLGMLDAQLFRAARVVVDIGMHLELEIPGGHRLPRGRAVDAGSRPRVPADANRQRAQALRRRDRPLPRMARPGAELQGRRAGVDRRPRRGAGPPRRHLRSQGLPHQGAAVRRDGPRPAGRNCSRRSDVSTTCACSVETRLGPTYAWAAVPLRRGARGGGSPRFRSAPGPQAVKRQCRRRCWCGVPRRCASS